MKTTSKSKYTSAESVGPNLSPNTSTTHIPHFSNSIRGRRELQEQPNDDSFDETNTYLTAMHEQKVIKRTATAVPGKRSDQMHREYLANSNRIATARPKIQQITNKTTRQPHLATSKSEQLLGKHFLMQSVISQRGLTEYDHNVEIIQQIDVRERGQIFESNLNLFAGGDSSNSKKASSNQKVIPRDQQSAELDKNLLNVVNLQQCIFKYLEVKLKGQNKPLYLFFSYSDLTSKFKMFLSRFTYTPNIFNCESVFNKKVVLKYNEPGDTLQFVSDAVYLAIFCSQSTTIQLKVQFGSGTVKKDPALLAAKRREDAEQPHISLLNLRKQIRLIKQNRREQILNSNGGDVIQKNMQMEPHLPVEKEKVMALRRVQSASRISEILVRKRDIDQEKKDVILQKYEHSQKVKILREIFRCYTKVDELLGQGQREWLKDIQLILMTKQIKHIFYNRLRGMIEEHFKKRVRNNIRNRVNRFRTSKGETIIKRTMIDQYRYAMQLDVSAIQMYARMAKRKSKMQARKLVERFMRGYGMIGDLVKKIFRTKSFVMKLEASYWGYKLRCKNYTDRIIKLWNNKWGVIYQRLMREDQERVKEIRLKQNKGVLNLVMDEDRQKAPFLDSKVQASIVHAYFSEIKMAYHHKLYNLLVQLKHNAQIGSGQTAQNVLVAAQQFGGESSELKKVKLFVPVNDAVLTELIHKYLSEKKLLKSEVLAKQLEQK